MDRNQIEKIIERVEQGSGPDRELDAEIMEACFPEWAKRGAPFLAPHCEGEAPIYWHAPEPYYKQRVPKLTASIDASVALTEKMGWRVKSITRQTDAGNFMAWVDRQEGAVWRSLNGYGPTIERAILSAALHALLATMEVE